MQSLWQNSDMTWISTSGLRFLRTCFQRICLLLIGSLAVTQSVMAQGKLPYEDQALETGDQERIKISYFKSSSGKDSPVVILLHGKKGTRLQWKSFATELQAKKDFAVVSVDLRGHGDSPLKRAELRKTDYQAMAGYDMEAVRDFLLKEHQKGDLNIRKQGIVACDFSAAVALVYAEMDWARPPYDDSSSPETRTPRGQDVRALALISPDVQTPGLSAMKAAATLKNLPIAVMIGVAEKNTHDAATSKKLYDQFLGKKEKIETLYFEKYPEDLRGMDLIQQDSQIRRHISDFLETYVKKAQVEWADRRSRLDRE